jgi:hypothetical protein
MVVMAKPIFIGGLQRSGTSLIRGIIGSHPEIAIFQWDLPLWTKFYDLYKRKDLRNAETLRQFISEILADQKALSADMNWKPGVIYNKLNKRSIITCGDVFQCILQEYAKQVGCPRWGLKTPHNEFFAGQIFNAYPDAKMIHVIRDPRDVAVSMRSLKWFPGIVPHAQLWKDSARVARYNEERFSESYIAVRYEDIVYNPEKTVQEICEVVELEYDPILLEMEGHPGWRGGNSRFSDIDDAGKISKSPIGRYQNHLSKPEVHFYQHWLKKELVHWQYEPQNKYGPWKPSILWCLSAYSLIVFGKCYWVMRGEKDLLKGGRSGIYRARSELRTLFPWRGL